MGETVHVLAFAIFCVMAPILGLINQDLHGGNKYYGAVVAYGTMALGGFIIMSLRWVGLFGETILIGDVLICATSVITGVCWIIVMLGEKNKTLNE